MKCPACSRNILTRRSGVCSFCGAALPAELRLTPEQLKALEAEERAAAQSRKRRQERDRQDTRGDSSTGWLGGSTIGGGWDGGDSGGDGGGGD